MESSLNGSISCQTYCGKSLGKGCVCISHIRAFYDFHVMFIQQTGTVSFQHYQWLRCIQAVKPIL